MLQHFDGNGNGIDGTPFEGWGIFSQPKKLTYYDYQKILHRAEKKYNHAHNMDERYRWFAVQARILMAMSNPKIFWR